MLKRFSKWATVVAVIAVWVLTHPTYAAEVGINTPGTQTYPDGGMRRPQGIVLPAGQSLLRTAAIDPAGDYAYFGAWTSPSHIIKVDLNNFSHADTLSLPAGDDLVETAVVDPTGSFAYFGTFTSPGKVIKVDLSDFTRVGSITFLAGEDELRNSAFIDPTGSFAYFGTYTFPNAQVVRVNLSTFTRSSKITFLANEFNALSAVMRPDGSEGYFGHGTGAGRVVRVNLSTFSRTGSVVFSAGEDVVTAAAVDPTGDFGYFGTWTVPARLVKVNLDTFTRVGAITTPAGEDRFESGFVDANGKFGYFGTVNFPGKVVKIDLDTFSRVDSIEMGANEHQLLSGVIRPQADFAFFGTDTSPGRIAKVSLSQKGYIKATKISFSEPAVLNTAHFYSHEAQGNLRLGIYSDGDTTRTLVWESASVANTATGDWIDVPIASGVPFSVLLESGDYHLAWQVDNIADIPSFTAGAAGEGFFVPVNFDAFPSMLTGDSPTSWTTTSETWSTYLSYDPAVPEIAIAPSEIEFGVRILGRGPSGAQDIGIANVGTYTLNIAGVSIVGPDASEFSISADTGESTLAPGEMRTISVLTDPSSVGFKSAILRIESDDANETQIDVPLSAYAFEFSSAPPNWKRYE